MKILYIHQYFKTPQEPGGTRSYWVAKKLIKDGHNVTMLTTSPDIQQKVKAKDVEGIDVIYVKVPYDQTMSVARRLLSFIRFMLLSTKLAWREKNIDLVISTSTPLTVGFPALLLKKLRGIPYIFEVRDLWPEVPIQMGAMNNKAIQALARWFEKTVYRNAQHVVALSPGMQDGVVRYISKNKTSVIPNMAKIDEFWPRKIDVKLVEGLGLIRQTFKIVHFGSLGLANGAEYIVEAASLMTDISGIEFIFVGGGSTEGKLKQMVADRRLHNVHFLGAFPMRETSEIVNFCDVSIVSFMDLPILYTNSPNKLFDSLSAGKPILVNSSGWTKELVEREKCGFFVDPKNPEDLVSRILYLRDNPPTVHAMGLRSRRLAEQVYDKTILCDRFAQVVNSVHSTDRRNSS